MAIYYAVASRRDFERNLNLGSDSSLDEIIMTADSDLAGVHAPAVSGSGASPPGWCRSSYSCPVHNSMQNTPPRVNNHHRNCPRAHLHQNPSSIMIPSSDSSSDHATPPEDEPDKSTTRWTFPHLGVSAVGTKTAELGYRALWSVVSDFLPWIVGSYVIFQAFKYGMLELGLAAFLLMLSVHGVLKWCNARGRDKREEDLAEYEADVQVDIQCNEHHHLHHHGHDLSDTDFSSSDDSDLEDDPPSIGRLVIVIDEPPPSYDVVSRATALDLDLQVHLTPRHPKGEHKGTPGFSENVHAEETEDLGTGESARPSCVSHTSCVSSEMEDDSLPSYSDAVKKIKRKKKRNLRTRVRRLESGCSTEEETLIRSVNYKDSAKISDIASPASDETHADPQIESGSMGCIPACSTEVQETVQENESTLPSREHLSDMNAMLDADAPCSSFAPSRGPYM
ncbi:hypothetical protein FHG87_005602 [Trinorchestia longiramus]|nr:hypothetical protein FHG87_005602 [Trinorchestia longiramus]